MINKFYNLRAPIWGLFLFLISLFSFIPKSFGEEIVHSNQWKALLYYQRGEFKIHDDNFYLSKEKTLESEFNTFVELLKTEKKQEIVCRFPARYYFLTSQLGYPKDLLKNCKELEEFKTRAPFDKVYVVFASENISIPTSMMGHIYFKMAGENQNKIFFQHAISFYTDIVGWNFPKLVLDSLVFGKDGFYALGPSEPLKNNYLLEEGRNVWEYELNFSETEKELIQNHLFELKNIRLSYYFHSFNCATLINQIVLIAKPEEKKPIYGWVTPLDVVRFITRNKLIKTQTVTLSNRWEIKSLLDSTDFSKTDLEVIKRNDEKILLDHVQDNINQHNYKIIEFSRAYNEYLFDEKKLSEERREKFKLGIGEYLVQNYPDTHLDLSQYKNPGKTKSTAQVIVGFGNEKNQGVGKITWLPASHMLEDDSSNYISESELQLSRITLAYNDKKKNYYIDEFNIYSATSLQPSDEFTGGLSGKFRLSYRTYFDSKMIQKRSALIAGSLGKTYRLHQDLDFFGLLGLNSIMENTPLLAPDLEVGFVVREIFNMKTIMSTSYMLEDPFKGESIFSLNLKHFLDLNSYGLLFEYNSYRNQINQSVESFAANAKFYF